MDDISPLAVFLKKHREAKGFNPREFADAIKAVGGRATTQAVQQWENTTPGQRTTRPNVANRHAIAKVLDCDINEFESAYRATRAIADASEDAAPAGAWPQPRSRLAIYGRFEQDINDSIRAKLPNARDCLGKVITPFGTNRRYDYLSPRLAVEWLGVRKPGTSDTTSLEGHLWHLLWLSRLDADTGIRRNYLFILVIATDDPDAIALIKSQFDRLRDEARVFGNTLTLCLASSPAEAADLVVAHEMGLAAPASTPPTETA